MKFDYTKEPGKVLLNRGLNKKYKPIVTILTPFYNAGKYFEQTFNCVMNQTFPYFEWIIVNDGSTKKEDLDLLDRLEKTDERITVLHKDNGGISTARNLAIKNSNTDIIYPLDGDDLIVPTFVECLYWGLYYNKDAAWCYTRNIGFQNQEYLWDKPFIAEKIKTFNFLTYSGAIRKKDLLEVGCYDEITKHYYEDWRTWLKLLSASKKPVKLGYYGFWYRRMNTGVLSIVRDDPERAELADQLIEEVANTVDTSVTAKEYPVNILPNKFSDPHNFKWENKVFENHEKTNIMFLIPYMESDESTEFNFNIIKNIDKHKAEISLITTINSENAYGQNFEEYVTDIFELPSFLDVENYSGFISYFIKSREIDVIVISDSYYGYYLLPWIRKEFPNIKIVDTVNSKQWSYRNNCFYDALSYIENLVDKTFVNSTDVQKYITDMFSKDKNEVEVLDNALVANFLYKLSEIKIKDTTKILNNDINKADIDNLALWNAKQVLEKQYGLISNEYIEQKKFLEQLFEDKNWIEGQWKQLKNDYSELKQWQETLQKDKDWIEDQWLELQKKYKDLENENNEIKDYNKSSIINKILNRKKQ